MESIPLNNDNHLTQQNDPLVSQAGNSSCEPLRSRSSSFNDGHGRKSSQISMEIMNLKTGNGSNGSCSRRNHGLAAKLASDQATQRFTDTQKKTLSKYSSVSYQPSHHRMYMDWLAEQPQKSKWERWFLIILIGLIIGFIGFMLINSLQALDRLKWERAKEYAQIDETLGRTFSWTLCISILFVFIGSSLVVFVHPQAAGSGVPETIAFLNGVVVHGTLSLKQLVVKFLGLVFATSSGLPSTTQGPLIAMGAVVGAGVGQFKSKTLNFHPKAFSQFRNAEERRSFTTAGIAAGVAAGFNAPIGGLLYAMEDLSSFWSRRLCWETFFCSGVAAVTANLFNSAFNGFNFDGAFGILHKMWFLPVQMNILILGPAILLGVTGGLLGALFTKFNVLWCDLRRRVLMGIRNPFVVKCARVVEPCVLAMFMVFIVIYLPMGFACTEETIGNLTDSGYQCELEHGFRRESFRCLHNSTDGAFVYNEVATLMQETPTNFFIKLTTRGTHRWLNYSTLFSIFPLWFIMTCITNGSAISGGLFVPTLISGALYGRAVGLMLCDLWKLVHYDPPYQPLDIPIYDYRWAWMDPGVMAVIGAGSLLGGMTRLTLAVTVIVVEMEQDIDLTIPLLLAIFVAKVTADVLSKPLWKFQLDTKALPYLDAEPVVAVNGLIVNLELFEVRDVMNSPVCTIHSTESVAQLAALLLQNDHGAYPVVQYDQQSRTELMYGIISRIELYVILCNDAVYNADKSGIVITPDIEYGDISVDYITDPSAALERVKMYAKFAIYRNIYINLVPFINASAPKVDEHHSLHRVYNLFRTVGLRHLTIVDVNNRVCGIITRKDLMTFNIEEKLMAKAAAELQENDDTDLPSISVQNEDFSDLKVSLRSESIAEDTEDTEIETKVIRAYEKKDGDHGSSDSDSLNDSTAMNKNEQIV